MGLTRENCVSGCVWKKWQEFSELLNACICQHGKNGQFLYLSTLDSLWEQSICKRRHRRTLEIFIECGWATTPQYDIFHFVARRYVGFVTGIRLINDRLGVYSTLVYSIQYKLWLFILRWLGGICKITCKDTRLHILWLTETKQLNINCYFNKSIDMCGLYIRI